MTEQLEVLNDASETESEEWDLIQHKDVQISGNTSDAESIEIINEDETLQKSTSESSPSDLVNCNDLPEEFPDQGIIDEHETKSTEEAISTTSNVESVNSCILSRYYPRTDKVLSLASGSKDAVYICMAVFIVGLAMLIIPEDDRYKTKSLGSMVDSHEDYISSLTKELQVYRESNENLKIQVKHLTEVVNGLQQFALSKSLNEHIGNLGVSEVGNQGEEIDISKSFYNNNAFNDFIYLIETYREYHPQIIQFLINNSTTSNITDNQFKNSSMLNDLFTHMYNESLQNTFDLFHKIPIHLKELTSVITQHKDFQPFVNKWGNKFNKFSKLLQDDIRKMKIKFAKHILKSINGIIYSFYRKMCNFEMHKVIKIDECKTLNFNKHLKKNRKNKWEHVENDGKIVKSEDIWQATDKLWKNNGKTFFNNGKQELKTSGNNEKVNKDIIGEMDDNVEEILADDSQFFTKEANLLLDSKIMEKNTKNYNDLNSKNIKFNKESNIKQNVIEKSLNKNNRIKRSSNNSVNQAKTNKITNINPNRKKEQIDSDLCKKGYLIKCNATNKSDDVVDVNWFLNVGNQRSEIRSQQSKVDWLFERARARREKSQYENQRRFRERPPLFRRSFNQKPDYIRPIQRFTFF